MQTERVLQNICSKLEDKPKHIVVSVTLKCPVLKANGFILCGHVDLLIKDRESARL